MFWMLSIIGAIVLVDQLSKYFLSQYLTGLANQTLPIWQGVFHLTYVENRGAAFGMLQNARWFFVILAVVILIAASIFVYKNYYKMNRLLRISISLTMGGAMGNLINRAFLGYVVDIFDFRLIQFAVFNVADSCICIGTIGIMGYLLFTKEPFGRAHT